MDNNDRIKRAYALIDDYQKRIVALRRDIEGMEQTRGVFVGCRVYKADVSCAVSKCSDCPHAIYQTIKCDLSPSGKPICLYSDCNDCEHAIIVGS